MLARLLILYLPDKIAKVNMDPDIKHVFYFILVAFFVALLTLAFVFLV